MGFLDKLMGMGGSKSDSKKQEIREIFNANVQDGDSYTVLSAMNMVTEKKLFEEIRTFYNYIIGYKDGNDPEIVIIPTDSELSGVEEPVCCKKSECREAKVLTQTCMFSITHPGFDNKPVDFGIIASTAWGEYVISVSYVDEYTPFSEFFQKRFAK